MGRDAKFRGVWFKFGQSNLVGYGIIVLDVGLSTTPTVEVAVTQYQAHGGIIITANHNPKQWNASSSSIKGEFLNAASGKAVLEIADKQEFEFAAVDHLGKVIPTVEQ